MKSPHLFEPGCTPMSFVGFGCERHCTVKPNSSKTGLTLISPTFTKLHPSVSAVSLIPPVSPAVPFPCADGSLPRLHGLASASGPCLAAVLAFFRGFPLVPHVQAPKFSAAFEEVYAGIATPPLPSRPWFAWGLPPLGAFPAAGLVSVRAVLALRSGWRVVCAGVSFRPRNRRNHPTPNTPLPPSPLMYNVRAIHLCVAASLLYVNQGPLLCCMIGANLHDN